MSDTSTVVGTETPARVLVEEAAQRGPEGSWKRFLVPGLLAALVVVSALAVTFVVLWLQTVDTDPAEVGDFLAAASPEIEDRAAEVANLLLNYDSTNLDEVSRQLLEVATGDFRQDYERVLGQGLAPALESAKSSSRGQIVNGPDVYFHSPSEAIAIVGVSQFVQSTNNPQGRRVDYVLRISFVETTAGGWKADNVEVLDAAGSAI